MTTSPERAVSFGTAAEDYDRYRVSAPTEILDRVVPAGCEAVLDLGAGTGAVTRHLVRRATTVYAVEPDARMRDVLTDTCPAACALEGAAEQIPLPDHSMDAVVVGSAWHWVDTGRAIPEIARVLRPGGSLAIFWNRRDRTVPWVADLEAFRRRVTNSDDLVERRIMYYTGEPWLPQDAPFTDIEIDALPWTATMTRDELAGLMRTFTGFMMSPEERKPEMMRRIHGYVQGDVRMGVSDIVDVPMLCHYWRARVS